MLLRTFNVLTRRQRYTATSRAVPGHFSPPCLRAALAAPVQTSDLELRIGVTVLAFRLSFLRSDSARQILSRANATHPSTASSATTTAAALREYHDNSVHFVGGSYPFFFSRWKLTPLQTAFDTINSGTSQAFAAACGSLTCTRLANGIDSTPTTAFFGGQQGAGLRRTR